MNSLGFIITAILYLAGIAYLGYRGYRKTSSNQDYLLAGRSAHPFVMAMSYGAAFISTSAIVGFGGVAGRYGMGLQWLVFMNIAVGIFIAFVFSDGVPAKSVKLLAPAPFRNLLQIVTNRPACGFFWLRLFFSSCLFTPAWC